MGIAVAVIAVILTLALVVWFVVQRKHPEAASGHSDRPADLTTSLFGPPNGRPAGPGAEDDGVPRAGDPAPGPSAESLGE